MGSAPSIRTLGALIVEGIVRIYWRPNKEWHERLVRVDRKGFREEVGEVVRALAPQHPKLALADAIAYPMEAHIDGLGPTQFNSVVGYSYCAVIVAEKNGCWLWIS